MEKPIFPINRRHLRHALSALTIVSTMVALPASAQNVEPDAAGVMNSLYPVPPSWNFLEDADQDGMMDIDEILWGMDPLNPDDGLSDFDGDEIFFAWEFAIGTNPTEADTDTDDWSDSEEYLLYDTDPLNPLSFPQGGSPDRGGDIAPTISSSVIPEPAAVLAALPTPPSLSNGDFSDVKFTASNSMLSSIEYQGGGFMWGEGAIGGWSAYVGSTVEVWDAGGEKFVELDGSPGNYGIKQGIANVKAGGYILTWRHSGRNSSKAGTDPYCLRVYYMNGSIEVPISQSLEFTNFSKMNWADNAFGFQITPEQLANAGTNPIYVAFIPTGSSLNTYGTLIDKVRLIPVEIDMAIASYGDLADLPDYDYLTKSPVSAPHEMDPGSLVITPTKNELHPRKRSKLTLSKISNPVFYGKFSLTMQGLDPQKIGIYETPDGGKPITLPKIWQASAFPASVTYYVGALPFVEEAELQDGTLEFGYTPTSDAKLIQPVEKDTVRVKVIPTSANLTISSIKDVDALPEDQGADGQGLMPPHEMEPGSLVVAPVDWRVTPTTRSKLVLQAKGAIPADAQFTLTSNNLSRVAIYKEQTGGTPLKDQELTWTASQLNAGVTVHVGALSFSADDAVQDGTLTLTGKIIPPGALESEAVEVKDTVRVRLEPLAVDLKIVRFNNDPDDLAENDLAETSSVSTPHEMDPGSLVFAPVDGYPHPPGYRSRLTLTRSVNTSAIGTITLSAEGLNNVAIYDDEQRFEDFRKVNLPKQWEVADFVNGLVLHVGSNPFATDAAAQDGTLTLTQRVSAGVGLPSVEIKDVVRVTLNPLAVDLAIASVGNEPYVADDHKLDGFTAPTPHELSPGSFVFIPVEGNPSTGIRSKLNLTAVRTVSTNGTYTLTAQNLSKVAIYNTAIGGTPLDLNSLSWNSAQFGNGKTFYVGGQSFTAHDDAQNGTLTFSFQESTSQNPTIMIEDKVRVRLIPVEVKVIKEGQTAAPYDGLVVKKTDTVRYRLSPGLPDTPLLLGDKIKWHWRILKLDGGYGEWTAYINGQGHTFTDRLKDAGIYEIKAVLNGQDFLFSRKSDAPHADPSKGGVQAIHTKGAHDCLGVVDEDWQIRLRDAAKNNLGSERWAEAVELVLENASNFPPGSDKCNAFIYEQGNNAGTPVPLKEKFGVSTWPPIAFDWWNDNTGRLDNAERMMTSERIQGWQRLPDSTNPQPGFVVSRPDLSGNPPKYHSHVGILDYDGSWISAGQLKVNKYYHPSSMVLDSVTGLPTNTPYQPQGYRKYVGTP